MPGLFNSKVAPALDWLLVVYCFILILFEVNGFFVITRWLYWLNLVIGETLPNSICESYLGEENIPALCKLRLLLEPSPLLSLGATFLSGLC